MFLKALALVLLTALPRGSTSAGQFVLTGDFDRVLLARSPRITNTFEFKAVVDGCRYKIAVFRKGFEFRRGHEEVAYDGQDSYRVFYGNEAHVDELTPDQPVQVNGFVSEPTIPSMAPNSMIYVWFPFLSDCYLRTEEKGKITCEFVQPGTFGKCRQPADLHLNRDDAAIVDEMRVFHPDEGFCQLVYQTKAIEKVGDASIPRDFRWSCYAEPKPGGGTGNQ